VETVDINEASEEIIELSIVMPCLNEAETIGTCIRKAKSFLQENGVDGEVIVADNGSTDGSDEIAESLGARVVHVPEKGYGNALIGGIAVARSKYVIVGDADDSYDFLSLGPFLAKLREGYDLVMGNRFKGGIEPGAMPPLHRYLGNPTLSGIGRLFFKSPVGDFHCGLRGFKREPIEKLNLRATGMEFASEMVVKATMHDLRIAEVPTSLAKDGRSRPPHLKSWKDGWRHLRFLLISSPRWLFFYPGILMTVVGSAAMLAWIITGPIRIGHIGFAINTMLLAALLIVLGVQTIYFAIFSKVYGVTTHLLPSKRIIDSFLRVYTLELGLLIGGFICLLGVSGLITTFVIWGKDAFGALVPNNIMRISIPSFTLTVAGVQTIFACFFLSVLELNKDKET
jgi:glycosyltransferase involved in cell wall biosynthesis